MARRDRTTRTRRKTVEAAPVEHRFRRTPDRGSIHRRAAARRRLPGLAEPQAQRVGEVTRVRCPGDMAVRTHQHRVAREGGIR